MSKTSKAHNRTRTLGSLPESVADWPAFLAWATSGRTQTDAARRLGVPQQTLNHWIVRGAKPRRSIAGTIALATRIPRQRVLALIETAQVQP